MACLSTLAALGVLFLLQYVHRGFRYPIAWDAPTYVYRVNEVGFDGLSRLGAVRSGSPLLLATLMQVTRQNAMTLVAVAPAVFAGVAGLGAAVMVRASLETKAVWVPVIGILAWVAFVDVGIIQQHLDNSLNVALVLGGLGAAIASMHWNRGAVAVGILLAAAGVAEWTFYAFAACTLAGALVLFAVTTARESGARVALAPVRGPAIALGGSAVVTALTFLAIPVVRGVGVAIGSPTVRGMLRQRFFERLHDAERYLAFPLAAAGAFVAARAPVSRAAVPARRLFLCLMASWAALTVVAGLAQWFGLPTAGGRLSSYFFVVPILTGVFVWWLARRTETFVRPRAGTAAAAAAAVVVASVFVVGFGVAAWRRIRPEQPVMDPQAVAQTAAAGRYLRAAAPDRAAVFTFSPGISADTSHLWWSIVQASLPAEEVPRARQALATPAAAAARPGAPPVVVLQIYNRQTFAQAQSLPGARGVAPGVVVLNGPGTMTTAPAGPTPEANTTPTGILWTGGVVVGLLFAVGLGWALALLPHDPVTVVGLAPGLGAAVIILTALAWAAVGLPLHGLDPLWPLVIGAGAGWGLAWWKRSRAAPDASVAAS